MPRAFRRNAVWIGIRSAHSLNSTAAVTLSRTSMNALPTMLAAADADWLEFLGQGSLLLLLISLSGVFSGSESVLFALSPIQIQNCRGSSNPFRRLAAQLMDRPKQTLTTILIGNTAVNVMLFATSYVLFREIAQRCGAWITPLAGIVSVLLVVVCGEVVPKALGVTLADRLAPYCAFVVRTAEYVLRPLGLILDWVVIEPLTRIIFGRPSRSTSLEKKLSNTELKTLLEMSRRGGLIDRVEDLYLREIIDLNQIRVRDIMIPRVEVTMFDINGAPDDLRGLMRRTHLTKIPVYDGVVDKIAGLIYAKMLFFEQTKPLRELVVPARYVPELITAEQLLDHFRKTRSQIAIAVDEYGGMAGLVTLEDVLEEIVGEIDAPEDQSKEPEIRQLSEAEYEISGRLNVHYWLELFGLRERAEWITTVAGLVTARLGRPAAPGESVTFGNVRLTVIETDGPRIRRLRLSLLENRPEHRGGDAI